MQKFAKFGLSNSTLLALKKKGFEEPTPIQEKIIPILLESEKDLVGQAQTGTGKTAAFGLPVLERIKSQGKHVQVLVLVPTRELANQVSEEINSLKGKKKTKIIPVYGGQSMELQLKRLKKGVDIVVGTPGRIIDHIKRKTLDLSQVSYVVLDEADEMLNMGFIEDVKQILSATNPNRITLLFSATMPKEIVAIARNHMKDYELIKVDQEKITVDLTDQIYFEVPARDKFEALCRIIDMEIDFYGLVFCRTKVDVDTIATRLMERGYDAEGLHGDLSQAQREKILSKFKNKRITILVATDVAARGIDIHDLTHVINYAIPQDPDAYVHRIGRTGRAGKEGTAITFITPEEYRKLMYIQKAAKTDIRKEKLPRVRELIDIKRNRIKEEIERMVIGEISPEFLCMARELLDETKAENIVAGVLQYTFQDQLDPKNYNEIRDSYPQIKGKTRLFIARGKRDRMTKRKIVEFIQKKVGVEENKIDNVQISDGYSLITVPFKEAEQILHFFTKEKKGKRILVKVAKEDKSRRKKHAAGK